MGAHQRAAHSFHSAAQRIRDSLSYLETRGESLDAWQSDTLARSLAYLQTKNYALATEAAFRACRPELYRTKAAVVALIGSATLSVAEVRAELERVADRAV